MSLTGSISRRAAAAFLTVAVTMGGALSCDAGARSGADEASPRATQEPPVTPPAAQPAATARPSRMWIALYSHRRGPARFVSIDELRETLYVEADGPNLEGAAIVRVARGRLDAERVRDLAAALDALAALDAAAIAAMRPIEPIEETGLLADVGRGAEGRVRALFGLALSAMAPDVAAGLERAAEAASLLDPHRPRAIVQVTRVEPARAERIRTDPRRFYAFEPVRQELVESMPGLLAAFQSPGCVVHVVGEHEEGLLADWRRRSNLRGLGETLFVQVDGDALRGVFQVHARAVPAEREP